MIKYSMLLPEVLPYLAADPSTPLAESAIKGAVIDLCKSSRIWRHYPDPQNLVSGVQEYDLEPLPNSVVSRVLSCRVDGVPITPLSTDQMDETYPNWKTDVGQPGFFTQIDTSQIILAPIPNMNIARGLVMTLALQPSQASTTFPDWIAAQYMEEIAAGARGKLMLIPGKPWTDQKTGVMYMQKLQDAGSNARESAFKGLGQAITRTTSHH